MLGDRDGFRFLGIEFRVLEFYKMYSLRRRVLGSTILGVRFRVLGFYRKY